MTAPVQERSRRTLDRMLGALEQLLKEKSFDKITIAELAARGDVAVGSIYARFADKQALLVGMHRRLHEKNTLHRKRLADPRTWEGRSIDDVIRVIVLLAVRYWRLHGVVLRTVAMAAMPSTLQEVAAELSEFNAGMVALVLSKEPRATATRVASAVEAAGRIITATLRHRTVLSGLVSSFPVIPEREFARQLIVVARALWADALRPVAGASP